MAFHAGDAEFQAEPNQWPTDASVPEVKSAAHIIGLIQYIHKMLGGSSIGNSSLPDKFSTIMLLSDPFSNLKSWI